MIAPSEQVADLFAEALAIPEAHRWPFDQARVQMLYREWLRRNGSGAQAREHLSAALDTIRRLPAPDRFRIAMAALDLLSEVASETPLLLIAEDAHWLDRPTADVLGFVARRLDSDPIVLLAAVRDSYPSAFADAGLPELRLGALDVPAAGKLLDATAKELRLAERNLILHEAAGNPLALIELPVAAARLERGPSERELLPLTERLERAFAARWRINPSAPVHSCWWPR